MSCWKRTSLILVTVLTMAFGNVVTAYASDFEEAERTITLDEEEEHLNEMTADRSILKEDRTSVNVLKPYPPQKGSDITIQGKNPPSGGADTHNLSVSSYAYQVSDMGARVYTSKWLTGSETINVSVINWTLKEYYPGATYNKLTLKLYNSKRKQVASKEIEIVNNVGSACFSGLSADSSYYVCFETPTNYNRYSFNGTISK